MTRTVYVAPNRVTEDPARPGHFPITSLAYVVDTDAGGIEVLEDLITAARLGPGYPTGEVILLVPFELERLGCSASLVEPALAALAGYADAPLEQLSTDLAREVRRYRIDNRYVPPPPPPNRRAPLATAAAATLAATWAALEGNPAAAGIIVLLGLAAAIVVELTVNR